ncbi:HAMP domain-containing protein [Candidatus Woesearchaeota archaeon]|nr:HAMP domain-containing protein [Candidatus Woesearchaeota archaeon]
MSIGSVAIVQFRFIALNQEMDGFRSLGREVHFNVENVVNTAFNIINLISHDDDFNIKNNDTFHDSFLKKYSDIYNVFEDILFFDSEGRVISAVNYQYSGNWKYMDVFQNAMNGHVSMSNVHFLTNPLRPIVSFVGPVYENDSFAGAIGIQLNTAEISAISNHVKFGNTGFSFVVDENYKIVAHPNSSMILTKLDDTMISDIVSGKSYITFYLNGVEYFGTYYNQNYDIHYHQNSYLNWTVVVAQEKNEVFSSMIQVSFRILLIVILLLVIVFVFVYLLARRIVKPITDINTYTASVATGNFSKKLVVKTGDELEDLAVSFNNMIDEIKQTRQKLEDYNKHLEDKVEKRTRELMRRNTELEKFGKLTIDRELRMIELKKELKKRKS